MRILIVRTSALGDVVHCLPALHAIRRAHPNATVGWVVEEVFAPLLDRHPDLDVVIPVRTRRWRRRGERLRAVGEVRALRRTLRHFRADVALDLMGNHKGALLARLSGARRVVGAAEGDRREPSSGRWLGERFPLRGEHAVDRALSLAAAALGADPHDPELGGAQLRPPVAEDHRRRFEEAPPFVALQLGAGWHNKRYPTESWAEVARGLVRRTGLAVWLPMAPGEEELAREVAARSGGAAEAVDAGPLGALVALLRRARLLVGGDTGPLHLAHALGTPVLCLMGPTDPRRHGPYGAPGRVLERPLPCSYCYRRLEEPKPCLRLIPPEDVVERAAALLEAAHRQADRQTSMEQ